MSGVDMRGFTTYADQVVEGEGDVSAEAQMFLAKEFDGARERMTNLASTVGTAGSFVLVLVALLVGFANGASEESSELVKASREATLLAQGCSDETPSAACDAAKLEQALQTVEERENRVDDLQRLNAWQAVAGGFVLAGFVFGIAGVLTNPVPGPEAKKNDTKVGTKAAWKLAVDRLGRKKDWVILSLLAQLGAGISIGVIGWDDLF
jgi:hypothetical protein